MTINDPTYGGLLMKDDDLALLQATSQAGRAYTEHAVRRQSNRARLESIRERFFRMHPETMTSGDWLRMRVAFLWLMELCHQQAAEADTVEFMALTERLERLRDRGLITKD